jgi:hypothetical protein
MKPYISTSFLLAAICASAHAHVHAQSDVFLCVDEHGNKEYKNTGTTKGCKRVDLPGITTIPAPKRPIVAQTAAKASPADFPKVDGGTQKARDNDRRQILLDELKTEEEKLTLLQKEYNNGEPERRGDEKNYAKYQERTAAMKEDISRTEKNIDALKRELANLK